MKKLTAILLSLVLLLSAAALCGCSAKETKSAEETQLIELSTEVPEETGDTQIDSSFLKEPENPIDLRLCGLWVRVYEDHGKLFNAYYHFYANGKCYYDDSLGYHYKHFSGNWAVVDDELVLSYELNNDSGNLEIESYVFRVEGDTLSLRESTEGTEGNDWYEYTKVTYDK